MPVSTTATPIRSTNEEGALLAGFMPWTLVAMVALVQALRHHRRLDARLGYLLIWFLVVLIFYNLPESKRGVYLLSLYPALTTIVALFLSDAISHRYASARPLRWLSRMLGALFLASGVGAIIGLVLLSKPAAMQWLLAQCGIMVEQLPEALRAQAHRHALISIVLPMIAGAVGIYLLRTRAQVENVFFAIVGGLVATILAVNLIVEPAVADTLTLKGFASTTMKIANGQPVGYWGSLDYDFAFYSGRNIQFVTKPDDQFDYVVSSENDARLMWPVMRARYESILHTGPTDFDGGGKMLLLKRIASAPTPESSPAPESSSPSTTPTPSPSPSSRPSTVPPAVHSPTPAHP